MNVKRSSVRSSSSPKRSASPKPIKQSSTSNSTSSSSNNNSLLGEEANRNNKIRTPQSNVRTLWTPKEDALLKTGIDQYGEMNWKDIAEIAC